MIVTIDGPAGTGKSTVARRLASTLGFEYLDTGAMYRMIAYKVELQQVSPDDHDAVASVARSAQLDFERGVPLLDGNDVSASLRTPDVTRMASFVAQVPAVREVLVARQRELAVRRNIVCEGRDQGTVAFPHAECKFFLTALPEVRARRRQAELEDQGQEVDFHQLLQEQTERDQRDEARSIAPLRPASDAVVVDTTDLAIEDVVRMLSDAVRQRQQSQMSQ